MKIALIGFMGSGKTTVAQELSKKINIPVIEMDYVVLEKTNSKDMSEVFQKGGEKLLRDWEEKLAEDWRDLSDAIISTGGGVVLNPIIIDCLKENNGRIVYLHASFSHISKRISKDTTPRPLFSNMEQAEKLYNFRLPLYKQYSDIIVETHEKPLELIVDEILKLIQK